MAVSKPNALKTPVSVPLNGEPSVNLMSSRMVLRDGFTRSLTCGKIDGFGNTRQDADRRADVVQSRYVDLHFHLTRQAEGERKERIVIQTCVPDDIPSNGCELDGAL